MLFVPALVARQGTSLINTLSNLGLLTNLKLCLDAGDSNSYDGSSQTWKDLSGGAYDFYRGTGSGSDASDPTFNGTAGKQSSGEYFSFDGGDWLTLAQSNPAWVNNLHKDSAKLAMCAWFYTPNTATGVSEWLFGTEQATASIGVAFGVGGAADGDVSFGELNGATPSTMSSTARMTSAQWSFLAASVDEAATTGILQINGTQETKTFSYTSPSASAATNTAHIAALGDTTKALRSGDRLASFAIWEGTALTTTQLTSIFTATRGKFGV